jgi:hypothetical protein
MQYVMNITIHNIFTIIIFNYIVLFFIIFYKNKTKKLILIKKQFL